MINAPAMPQLTPGRLVAATHNRGKVTELKDLFEPHGFDVVSALELGLDEPDETEDSFSGNALLKARAAMKATGFAALSDVLVEMCSSRCCPSLTLRFPARPAR